MISNLISLSRIFLILPIIFCMMINNIYLAFLLFLIASFTDFLDGYIARYLRQESILGANLDLLADKIFVSSLLIFISFHFDNLIYLLMTILIIAREISIGTIRQYLLETNKKNKAKVNFLGKLKTFFQIFSIGVAMIFLDTEFSSIVEVVVVIAAALSWLSLLNYSYEKS
ncbi:CDP-diacylglycerol--glycerol-3-phosphate 3-phosphatidyltransferase [SAR86 cluster bacterium]|nr:CDP-diacylglycerol--glycerol-3-phosphate 3-phosphatidyltransferase [SAR86 cluster bacterium]|tara:strand:+ start:716 stop:1228 length:513 start_codon:yes stop_codon:yes gene_type:complete